MQQTEVFYIQNRYNLKEYTDFCSLLRAKASALNAAAQGKPVAKPWTASMVEKALWSAAAREAFRSGKSSARKVEQGLDENRKRRKKQ